MLNRWVPRGPFADAGWLNWQWHRPGPAAGVVECGRGPHEQCSRGNRLVEDAPDMPVYTVPDVLTTVDGRKIATANDWLTIRRPEVLELFRTHVYGRVPVTPYQKSFRIVREDPNAMDGTATLKQVEITMDAAGKSLTIHLTL